MKNSQILENDQGLLMHNSLGTGVPQQLFTTIQIKIQKLAENSILAYIVGGVLYRRITLKFFTWFVLVHTKIWFQNLGFLTPKIVEPENLGFNFVIL